MAQCPPNSTACGPSRKNASQDKTGAIIETITDALSRLKFGAVHLTIHDGRVVQVDVTERQRFG